MDKLKFINISFLIFILIFSYYYVWVINRNKEEGENYHYETYRKKENNPYVIKNGKFILNFESEDLMEFNKNIFIDATKFWNIAIRDRLTIYIDIKLQSLASNKYADVNILSSNENNLTNKGIIKLNKTVWYDKTVENTDKIWVIKHELAHILGLGLKWIIRFDEINGQYLSLDDYPLTMEAYVDITGIDNDLGIPIESSGGRGVANIHWENNDREFAGVLTKGIPNDIMSCCLEKRPVVSLLTLNNLRDLGWDINTSLASEINFDLPRDFGSKRVE